ncbi:hypothetical protein EGW08_016507 [Elysia chlorotica]|uniref:Uncharacterized protein n=1 Tax=Elysia chlorotica TaxID=188477 RepID=A0A433T2E1_ELYCH|nr:hypothetical protein EGW08_016507 [Elysia chlorotica]
MSFFLPDEFKEEVVSGGTTFVQEEEDQLLVAGVPDAQIDNAATGTAIARAVDNFHESSSTYISFNFDLQAFVSVLSFLVLVAVLCGWFDWWFVRNREPAAMSGRLSQVHWRPEVTESFQTALEGQGQDSTGSTGSRPRVDDQDSRSDQELPVTTQEQIIDTQTSIHTT